MVHLWNIWQCVLLIGLMNEELYANQQFFSHLKLYIRSDYVHLSWLTKCLEPTFLVKPIVK